MIGRMERLILLLRAVTVPTEGDPFPAGRRGPGETNAEKGVCHQLHEPHIEEHEIVRRTRVVHVVKFRPLRPLLLLISPHH